MPNMSPRKRTSLDAVSMTLAGGAGGGAGAVANGSGRVITEASGWMAVLTAQEGRRGVDMVSCT
jgi:hypothetical protein